MGNRSGTSLPFRNTDDEEEEQEEEDEDDEDEWSLIDMPDDVLLAVFQFLSTKERLDARVVCHRFNELLRHEFLWSDFSFFPYRKRLDDALLAEITLCLPGLNSINLLQSNDISDEGCRAMAENCPYLQELDMAMCENVSVAGLTHVLQGCSLRKLNIAHCERIDVLDALNALSTHAPRLTSLNINYVQNLDDKSMATFAQAAPQLQELRISVTKAGDATLQALAQWCKSLRILELDTTPEHTHVTDVGVEALAKCTRLEWLSLRHQSDIQHGVAFLLRECPLLTFLDISFCSGVTSVMGDELPELPELALEVLIGNGLPLTDNDMAEVLGHAPKLRELKVIQRNLASPSLPKGSVGHLSMQALARVCWNLQDLHVDIAELEDEDVHAIAGCCGKLQSASLFSGSGLQPETVQALLDSCERLTTLNCSMGTVGRGKLRVREDCTLTVFFPT